MGKTAGDVMTRDVITIRDTAPIRDLIEAVREEKFSGMPVVDGDGKVVGVASQNDVLRAFTFLQGASGLQDAFHSQKRRASVALLEAVAEKRQALAVGKFLERPVKDVMSANVLSCGPDTPLVEVCKSMTAHRLRRIVIVDADEKPVGLIAALDLVGVLAEELG